MKDIDEFNIPDDKRYSDDHEWAGYAGNMIRVGISDYAQDQLGDIVFVELPQIGERFEINQQFGVVESVKSVSDILMPVNGEITAVNTELEINPALVNESPYEKGWMVEVKPDSSDNMENLMDADTYIKMLKGSN